MQLKYRIRRYQVHLNNQNFAKLVGDKTKVIFILDKFTTFEKICNGLNFKVLFMTNIRIIHAY